MPPLSREVLRGGELTEVLDRIAAQAASVVAGVDRASIVLIEGSERRFRLGGSSGLSERYRQELSHGEARLCPGEGPSGIAYVRRRPVVVDDMAADPLVSDWVGRRLADEEGYRAIVSLPLIVDHHFAGTLNLYREAPGPWPTEQVSVLSSFADHAASAVRTALLLDQRAKQVLALERLVHALREQAHEHVNRLHAISGLLELGEIEEAKGLLNRFEELHIGARREVDARIEVPVVAGLVLAETTVAAQQGITLEVDEASALSALPAMLSDTQIVTILGNLLDNAFYAVAELPAGRRIVRLLAVNQDGRTVLEVSDCGNGLPTDARTAFERGATTKNGHPGVGLSLVHEAVTTAMGTIDVDTGPSGTRIRIEFDG